MIVSTGAGCSGSGSPSAWTWIQSFDPCSQVCTSFTGTSPGSSGAVNDTLNACSVLSGSVAPAKEYLDKVTKKMIAPVTTPQIYWGAIPFLVIQLMMVGLIIAFPGIVSSGLDKAEVYDLDKVRMEMEATMPDAAGAPEATDPTAGMEGASAAPGDAAAPAADDPLKALQDSMANEKK